MQAQVQVKNGKKRKKKKKRKINKTYNMQRSFKEIVMNMQEMLLIGAGIHTKFLRDGVKQIIIIMGDQHKGDL